MSHTKIAIPLGETGSLIYLDDNLNSYFQEPEKKIQEFRKLKISNLYVIDLSTEDRANLKNKFPEIQFHDVEKEISFFDNVLISNQEKNILILTRDNLDKPIAFIGKLLLANDPNLDFKILVNFLELNFPNVNFQEELNEFHSKLESSYYHIKKENSKNFNFLEIEESIKPKEFFETEYNLSALDLEPSDESIFFTNPKIEFNVSSLKEISEEEFTVGSFTDESNALDMNLSSELNFIDSIEENKDEIEIETIPLESKKEIDFDEIVNEEIQREEEENSFVFGESSLKLEDFQNQKSENIQDLSHIIEEDLDEDFKFDSGFEELTIENKKILESAELDLSFPKSLENSEIKIQSLKPLKPEFDPTHTFISKRIQDVILNEVLIEEDSKPEKHKTPAQSFKGIQLED